MQPGDHILQRHGGRHPHRGIGVLLGQINGFPWYMTKPPGKPGIETHLFFDQNNQKGHLCSRFVLSVFALLGKPPLFWFNFKGKNNSKPSTENQYQTHHFGGSPGFSEDQPSMYSDTCPHARHAKPEPPCVQTQNFRPRSIAAASSVTRPTRWLRPSRGCNGSSTTIVPCTGT